MFELQMAAVGQIATVGTVQVFGVARHTAADGVTDTVYLNAAGPPTAIDALWARLAEGRSMSLTGRGPTLTIRHSGWTGLGKETPYRRFVRRVPGLAVDHVILLDKRALHPPTGAGVGSTFVFDGPRAADRIAAVVEAAVDVAVFRPWYPGVSALGRRAGLVLPCQGAGHRVYAVSLDRERWERTIAAGVADGSLAWPGDDPKPALTLIEVEAEMAVRPDRVDQKEDTPYGMRITREGTWTWVTFEVMPPEAIRDVLKRLGFRWGRRRKGWYSARILDTEHITRALERAERSA